MNLLASQYTIKIVIPTRTFVTPAKLVPAKLVLDLIGERGAESRGPVSYGSLQMLIIEEVRHAKPMYFPQQHDDPHDTGAGASHNRRLPDKLRASPAN
jgi:hypothetical protein